MGQVMISGVAPKMTKPFKAILLSNIAEGSVVKLNENGSPVDFYVAKHDYESALNGTGKTLLVRKNCYGKRQWHSSNVSAYASSDISNWLINSYQEELDQIARNAILKTKIRYTIGNGNNSLSTMECLAFLLSLTELGLTTVDFNAEGSTLSVSSIIRISDSDYYTRTPNTGSSMTTAAVFGVGADGKSAFNSDCTNQFGIRPALTLPSTAIFDEETMLLKGVS